MSRMLGANITSMLMNVSRMRAMAMWRIQLKDLVGNIISCMALRTYKHNLFHLFYKYNAHGTLK